MEGLFRTRKASQCSDSIPFLELWREEGQRLGLEGTLSRGSDRRGLLPCGPLWGPCGAGHGRAPLWEAPITITMADATDPTEQLGPKCRVTLTPPAIETDRGGALPHNAQAPLPSSSSFHFLQPLSSGPWGPLSLSHSSKHCPLNSKRRPLGKGSGTFSPALLSASIPHPICPVSR